MSNRKILIALIIIIISYYSIYRLNILLDESSAPKLGDSGLVAPNPQYIGSTHIIPAKYLSTMYKNRGYTAPECADGKITTKADVHSYSVVSHNYK